MILPDTSAWVEVFRGTGSPLDRALTRLIEEDASVFISEPVVMEVLAGARSDRELLAMRGHVLALSMLRVDGLATFERAAAIQRACRAAGETVRGLLDCLLAAVAIREGASILHDDRDFDIIARHTELRIEPVRA